MIPRVAGAVPFLVKQYSHLPTVDTEGLQVPVNWSAPRVAVVSNCSLALDRNWLVQIVPLGTVIAGTAADGTPHDVDNVGDIFVYQEHSIGVIGGDQCGG